MRFASVLEKRRSCTICVLLCRAAVVVWRLRVARVPPHPRSSRSRSGRTRRARHRRAACGPRPWLPASEARGADVRTRQPALPYAPCSGRRAGSAAASRRLSRPARGEKRQAEFPESWARRVFKAPCVLNICQMHLIIQCTVSNNTGSGRFPRGSRKKSRKRNVC